MLLAIQVFAITLMCLIGTLALIHFYRQHKKQTSTEDNKHLQALFDTVLDGLIIIDEHGLMQNANPAACQMFDYTKEQLLGSSVSMLIPTEYRREYEIYFKRYSQTDVAKVMASGRELIGQRKNGSVFELDLRISEMMLDGQRMFVGITRNISERKKMEKLYRLIAENVEGYATLILDPNGTIISWNKGAQQLKGYSEDEILGQSFTRFYTSEDKATNLPARLLEKTRLNGHAVDEGWRVKKDGSQFYAEVVLNSLQEADGSLLGFVKVTRDMTERKRLDMELQQAYSNLEEFTSVASHDLKSPIRGIADLISWITEDLGEDTHPDVKKNLDRVQVRIKRMESLIEDLLQYSRAGRTSADLKLIEPQKMIADILELQHFPDGFEVHVTGQASPFRTAAPPLETSLRNLISNALKHHDQDHGRIDIHLKDEGSYCVISIADDGPGVPQSAQERIFKLFQTLSNNKDASGVGLAVAKRMVEAHGGHIKLDSTDGKRGAIFSVWWPRFETSPKKQVL